MVLESPGILIEQYCTNPLRSTMKTFFSLSVGNGSK